MLKFLAIIILFTAFAVESIPLEKFDEVVSSESHNKLVNVGIPIETRPYQVSIRSYDNDTKTYIHKCSGVIISKHWIISVANCFDFIHWNITDPSIVVAGSADLTNGGTFHRIEKTIFYLWYSVRDSLSESIHDVILIRVAEPFEFDATRKAVQLFGHDEETPAGSNATISGWGWNGNPSEGNPDSKVLNLYNVSIVSKYECDRLRHGELTYGGQICAARINTDNNDSCSSDNGGPLIVDGRLAGILTLGHLPCAGLNNPGVYAEIAHFRNWIKNESGV